MLGLPRMAILKEFRPGKSHHLPVLFDFARCVAFSKFTVIEFGIDPVVEVRV